MGETIRLLMVATIAISTLFAVAGSAEAQGSFQIPQSLSGGNGSAADAVSANARSGAGSDSRATSLPSFTDASSDGPARSRPGGPTTEPVLERDRNWMMDGGGRPTTDPLGNQTGRNALGANSVLGNQLRGGNIAPVGATQDPNSREAQFTGGQRRDSTGDATGTRRGTNGFAALPDGVRLPPRTGAAGGGETYGSEFARDGSGANSPNRPVYGPPTAAEANFDWSGYNADRSGSANDISRQSQSRSPDGPWGTDPGVPQGAAGTAQQQLSLPGSGLGMPGAPASNSNGRSPTTDWTAQQIAALAAQFGIPANDPKLQDELFVNELYVRYRQAQQGQAPQGRDSLGRSGSGGTAGKASGGLFSSGLFTDPTSPPDATRSGDPPEYGYSRVAGVDARSQPLPSGDLPGSQASNQQTTRSGKRVQMFDSFGNRIDAQGNILDANGNPVDEATVYELTIGKKLREDMERLAKQQADLLRRQTEQIADGPGHPAAPASPSDARHTRQGTAGSTDGRVSVTGTALGGVAQRPPSGSATAPERFGNSGDIPPVDQAGVGSGAANAIARSNPYVNVFLLCSLVSNAFLFVWLHRLWHHHRDLIASSRMASSGISSND